MEGILILVVVVIFLLVIAGVYCRKKPTLQTVPTGKIKISTVDERYYLSPHNTKLSSHDALKVISNTLANGETVWFSQKDEPNRGYRLTHGDSYLGCSSFFLYVSEDPGESALIKFIPLYTTKPYFLMQVQSGRYVSIYNDAAYLVSERERAREFKVVHV